MKQHRTRYALIKGGKVVNVVVVDGGTASEAKFLAEWRKHNVKEPGDDTIELPHHPSVGDTWNAASGKFEPGEDEKLSE